MIAPRVAIVGASTELSGDLADMLVDRGIAGERLRLLGGDETAGETVDVRGRRVRIEAATRESLAEVDVALFCGDPRLAARLIPQARDGGALSVDATGCTRGLAAVPAVVPEVNGDQLEELAPGSVVASPDPLAVALALVLAPLHRMGGVRRVVATVLAPASRLGAVGIEALSRQSVALMQGRSLDRAGFPEQLAFNLRVQPGQDATGWSDAEEGLAAVVPALLSAPETVVAATLVRAPVFFGTAISLDVEIEGEVGVEQVVGALREGQGLLVSGSPEETLARALAEHADAPPGATERPARRRGDPSEVDFAAEDADGRDDDFDDDEDDDDLDEDFRDDELEREDGDPDEDEDDDEAELGAGEDDDGGGEESGEAPPDPSPGPVDVAGSDYVHVSRVRVDPRRPTAIAMWIAFDEVRRGVARNLVAILETVVGPGA
ncbi:MAG: Asd/ArgC dimerization domain-containing protein [Alphaproteobacteria bacterium]